MSASKTFPDWFGHSATGVSERVYRHQLHAVLDEGATAMDDIFPLDDTG